MHPGLITNDPHNTTIYSALCQAQNELLHTPCLISASPSYRLGAVIGSMLQEGT